MRFHGEHTGLDEVIADELQQSRIPHFRDDTVVDASGGVFFHNFGDTFSRQAAEGHAFDDDVALNGEDQFRFLEGIAGIGQVEIDGCGSSLIVDIDPDIDSGNGNAAGTRHTERPGLGYDDNGVPVPGLRRRGVG